MSQVNPPGLIRKLLHKMFPVDQMEEIEGDLLEDYTHNLIQYGKMRAGLFYCLDVLRLFRLYRLLSKRKQQKNTVMNKLIFFHLKYGLRSLYRQRLYQALNVGTLTLGFSCFTLIFLFVYNQKHKDNFLVNSEQIVRLGYVSNTGEHTNLHGGMPEHLQKDFAEIESYTRLYGTNMEVSLPDDEESFTESVVYSDSAFINIFQMELLQGRKPTPGQKEVLISERLANKLFGHQDVLGELLSTSFRNRSNDYAITGILKDAPVNSSFSNDLVIPMRTDREHPLNANSWSTYTTYFKVAPGTDLEVLAGKIPEYLTRHTEVEPLLTNKYLFRSLEDIKSDPAIGDLFIDSVDGQVVFIFSIVGLVVLFLAIANYVNLLAALSLRRMQEMSIKKVMGASVRALVVQQLIESFIICAIALLFSSLIVGYLLQPLQSYLGVPLKFSPLVIGLVVAIMIIIPIALTLLASLYPAVLMSGVKFHELLKGKMSNSPKSRFVRNALLTVQFAISSFLIVGTLTFVKQIGFIKSLHKADEIGEVLILKGKLDKNDQLMKQGLLSLPEVDKVSISSLAPGPDDNSGAGLATEDFEHQFDLWVVDRDFLDIMGLEMAEGNNFYDDERNRSTHVLFNEALVDIAKENPFGKTYKLLQRDREVIGIIRDFPIQSAKLAVDPGMFVQAEGLKDSPMFSNLLNKVAIRLNTSDYETAIGKIEEAWTQVYPDQPFDIEFMDARLDRVYTAEYRMGQLFSVFTGVAILISCLGILGLLIYLIQVKMKELGIRKVLGANFFSQVKILTINIWKVLIISNILAFPLSFYFLQDWLESFAHRTEITTGLFAGTFIIFCAIISLSALWQVLRVNKLNPSEVLRTE
ncbi:MAG: hypothetical protein HEP71_12945 [Roseivirga sp.]|nr:hypothetical protein [Roseivirga sp.]